MARTMIHPYWGTLVVCGEIQPSQHKWHEPEHMEARLDECEICNRTLVSCVPCQGIINCCWCGRYHAIECPWPL